MTTMPAVGEWITHPAWAADSPPWAPPTLRAVWSIDAPPTQATVFILAVGVWEARLRGRPLSSDVLEPGSSDVRQRIPIASYDITGLLRHGDNEFILQLGEGPAHVRSAPGRYTKFEGRALGPRARVVLKLVDGAGRIRLHASGPDWTARLGPTALSHWYGGEDYDARNEPEGWLSDAGSSDEGWIPASVLPMALDPVPWRRGAAPVRVQEILEPEAISPLPHGFVADFGRNLAGVAEVEIDHLGSGEVLVLRPAEYLDAEGIVDQFSTGAPVFDRVTGAGGPLRWHPLFTYHGFRYVQVERLTATGEPAHIDPARVRIRALRMMSDERRTGALRLGDPSLDAIDRMITRAAESNLFTVPTDCPHREKLGWLEQLHYVFAPLAFRWDIRAHWRDMITHIADAQTSSGLIPSIAPELVVFDFDFEPGFRDDVNWGGAIWHLPRLLHTHYGDIDAARAAWEPGLRYLAYLDERAAQTGGLLSTGLGDWIAIDQTTPRSLVAGYGHAAVLDDAVAVARLLGHTAHARTMSARAREIRAALREKHLPDAETGSQGAAALLADSGALTAEEKARAITRLVTLLERDGYQQTVGEIALPALLRVLSGAERHDVIHRFVTQTNGPGYGQMLADGATALCEHWQGTRTRRSANHFMLGAVGTWFLESLAGLRQADDSVAWRHAEVSPRPLPSLSSADADFDSPAGRYLLHWVAEADRLRIRLTVPPGAHATVTPPPGYEGASVVFGGGTHEIISSRTRT